MKILKWKQMTKNAWNFIFRRCCERHNGLLLMHKRYRGVFFIRKIILDEFYIAEKDPEVQNGFRVWFVWVCNPGKCTAGVAANSSDFHTVST